VDASIGIAACLLMGFLLSKLDHKQSKPAVERVSLASELLQQGWVSNLVTEENAHGFKS